jgi:hypothetical protein
MKIYSSESFYRGFKITKTIKKNGATVYSCEIEDGVMSVASDPRRILNTIDQKLGQEFLNGFTELSKF